MQHKPKPVPPKNILHDVLLRGIKLIDIGYITVIYFFIGLGCAMLFDKVLGKFVEQVAFSKSLFRLFAELIVYLWTLGVIMYLGRNVAELIPSPLDGIAGFRHDRVKELSNAYVLGVVILLFSEHLRQNVKHVYLRMFL
jgi:hypothetical protein